jgi:hypothetical protein
VAQNITLYDTRGDNELNVHAFVNADWDGYID